MNKTERQTLVVYWFFCYTRDYKEDNDSFNLLFDFILITNKTRVDNQPVNSVLFTI